MLNVDLIICLTKNSLVRTDARIKVNEGVHIYKKIIEIIENNSKYVVNTPCEPQLGKRGLYPTISTKNTQTLVEDILNILAYCDGKNDLIDLCDITNISPQLCIQTINKLKQANLLEEINENI